MRAYSVMFAARTERPALLHAWPPLCHSDTMYTGSDIMRPLKRL